MMTDPIADMLTRLRNASLSRKKVVVLPYSKIKMEILDIIKKEHYIEDYKVIENKFKELEVKLKYKEDGKSQFRSISRVSKSSRRVYRKKGELPVVLNNFGIAIISTSQGLMTNKEAKVKGCGGEVVCEIY